MIFWLDGGGTMTHVLLFIRASNSRCIAYCYSGTLVASWKEFSSQGGRKIVSIGDKNILGLKTPFLARIVMGWQGWETWEERGWAVGIGATTYEEIDIITSDIGTNSEGGLNGESKRKDIGVVGTTKGMTQWEREI